MTFNEEQKQAEFEAFSAYFAAVSKRSHTTATRSLLSQLRSIAVGQFGNGAYQEFLRANRPEVAPQVERTTAKPSGGGSRRNQSPVTQKAPPQGSPRYLRNLQRQAAQGGKSEQVVVAAESQVEEFSKRPENFVSDKVQLSTGAIFNTETGRTENGLAQDAQTLSAKDLVEKYGRELIFEHLLNAGHDGDELEQKSDRQLANLLKKEAAKQ